MNLHEYQSKRLFADYGIPVPAGDVASSRQEVLDVVERLEMPVVVKAQVLVGGRGKAGGIVRAATADEAVTQAERLLGSTIRGLEVRRVLIERAVEIAANGV